MRKHQNLDWAVPTTDKGAVQTWEHVGIVVMMDIRDELRKLNALLHCNNTVAIPDLLRAIKRNTTKPPKVKRKAAA